MTERLGEQFSDLEQQRGTYELGMWFFLASEMMLFGGLFLAYLVARSAGGAGFEEGSRHTDVLLGGLNTGLLLASSYTMALAVDAGREGDRRRVLGFLAATGLLGLGFLGIKGFEWRLEYLEGLVPGFHFTYDGPHAAGVRLFFWQYFVMTGLHALHLVVAVLMVGFMVGMAWPRGPFRHPSILEAVGLYWHLVDLIWIFLFPLLYLIARGP